MQDTLKPSIYTSMGDEPTERITPTIKVPGKVQKGLAPGAMIDGRYVVLCKLGEGGMGVVYKCFDNLGGVEVAVKGLPPEVSRNEDEMEEIRANYQIVGNLHHQNIVGARTLEKDKSTGDFYLVMDLASGTNLRRWMRHNPQVSMESKLSILRQVAAALDYAHSQKVIHRDVKPENVMVDGDGCVKVLDFGLAAQIRSSQSRTRPAETSRSGTPGYKSPEQWLGCPQHSASDEYSFGVLAYWMLAGELPFDGDDPVVLGQAVLTAPVRPVPGISKRMNAVLAKALAKKPEKRFASCGEVVDALEAKGGCIGKVLTAVVLLGLAAAGIWWWNARATNKTEIPQGGTKKGEGRETTTNKPLETLTMLVGRTPAERGLYTVLLMAQTMLVGRTPTERDLHTVLLVIQKMRKWIAKGSTGGTNDVGGTTSSGTGIAQGSTSGTNDVGGTTSSGTGIAQGSTGGTDDVGGGMATSNETTVTSKVEVANEWNVTTNENPKCRGRQRIVVTSPDKQTKLCLVWCEKKGDTAHGFWMGETEVTRKQWYSVMGEAPSRACDTDWQNSDLPATSVTCCDCTNFIKRLSEKTNLDFSLPDSNRWVFACLAGNITNDYWWGNRPVRDGKSCGNFGGEDWRQLNDAGNKEFPPNAWGLYDMHGNAAEWCNGGFYFGGSYCDSAEKCTARYNVKGCEDSKSKEIGFRMFLNGGKRK